uniref:Uncharacterized protein n=1 Tax=Oryza brachyantha TaxID=4533 RepID=J3M042_ORYBR
MDGPDRWIDACTRLRTEATLVEQQQPANFGTAFLACADRRISTTVRDNTKSVKDYCSRLSVTSLLYDPALKSLSILCYHERNVVIFTRCELNRQASLSLRRSPSGYVAKATPKFSPHTPQGFPGICWRLRSGPMNHRGSLPVATNHEFIGQTHSAVVTGLVPVTAIERSRLHGISRYQLGHGANSMSGAAFG